MDILLETLETGDPVVQAEAARLLGEAAVPEAVPALLHYVDSCQHFHKSAGFTALGRIGETSVCERIYGLCNDPRMRDDWYWFGWRSVRAAAAHALLMLGDDRGSPILLQMADDADDVFFSFFAPSILRMDKDQPGVDELIARLTVESLHAVSENSTRLTDPGRLTLVVEALGEIGGPAAADKAGEYLDHPSRFVRGQAAVSVFQAGATQKFFSLMKNMSIEDPAEFAQARAAFALKDEDRLELLVERGKDAFSRGVAIEGLGYLGARGKSNCLMNTLKDEDAYVRQCSLEALERIQAPEAQSLAHDALSDSDLRVRCQAEKTLIILNGRS